jgi:hypothetical protein
LACRDARAQRARVFSSIFVKDESSEDFDFSSGSLNPQKMQAFNTSLLLAAGSLAYIHTKK